MSRKYELKRRAERQDQTRRQIARAVFELHSTIGPANTTVKGIAERAGVDRVTVYRHFPDDLALYRACLTHWTAEMPLPDETAWGNVADPLQRLTQALSDVYQHYEQHEGMWSNGWRDLPRLPLLAQADAPVFAHFERMRSRLLDGWSSPRSTRRALAAVIGHVLEFPTWESFVRRQGLTTKEAIELVARFVACIAGVRSSRDTTGVKVRQASGRRPQR
jgi:AcrR family transcriptional regulator